MSYAFRPKSADPSYVANLYGQQRQVLAYKRGREHALCCRDLDERHVTTDAYHDPHHIKSRLRVLIAETIARYAASKVLTDTELRTIHALWVDDLSLREVARREGVSAEAIRQRIEGSHGSAGIRKKALEFYQWWSFKNRMRRKKGVFFVAGRLNHLVAKPPEQAA